MTDYSQYPVDSVLGASYSPLPATFSESEQIKIRAIQLACQAADRASIVEKAIAEDGLVSDEARREACKPSAPHASAR